MKSTMKSAFAFIAVALMIMVAVVPMVSVFTEENGVDAATADNTNVLKNVEVTVWDVDTKDKSKLIAYGTIAQIWGGSMPSDVKKLTNDDESYYVYKKTGTYVRYGDVPGATETFLFHGPMMQISYQWSQADINAVSGNITMKLDGKDVTFNAAGAASFAINRDSDGTATEKKIEGVQTVYLYNNGSAGIDYIKDVKTTTTTSSVTSATCFGEYEVKLTATQGLEKSEIVKKVTYGTPTTVSGKITDANSNAILGATVNFKVDAGTKSATTDKDGKYIIYVDAGAKVSITSISYSVSDAYTFTEATTGIIYDFGAVEKSVNKDFKAKEKTATITVTDKNGVALSEIAVEAAWYYQYKATSTATTFTTETSAPIGVTAGKLIKLSAKTDVDGKLKVAYTEPTGSPTTTGVNSYANALVAYVSAASGPTYHFKGMVDATTQTKSFNEWYVGNTSIADAKSGSAILKSDSSTATLKVTSANGNPAAGVTISVAWYYQYKVAGTSPATTYTIGTSAPTGITPGTVGAVSVVEKDGMAKVPYTAPTGSIDATVGTEYSAALIVYASGSAGYTVKTAVTVPTSGADSLATLISKNDAMADASSGVATVKMKENTYAISGNVLTKGVSVAYTNPISAGLTPVLSDKDGNYLFYILEGKGTVITPTISTITFEPASFALPSVYENKKCDFVEATVPAVDATVNYKVTDILAGKVVFNYTVDGTSYSKIVDVTSNGAMLSIKAKQGADVKVSAEIKDATARDFVSYDSLKFDGYKAVTEYTLKFNVVTKAGEAVVSQDFDMKMGAKIKQTIKTDKDGIAKVAINGLSKSEAEVVMNGPAIAAIMVCTAPGTELIVSDTWVVPGEYTFGYVLVDVTNIYVAPNALTTYTVNYYATDVNADASDANAYTAIIDKQTVKVDSSVKINAPEVNGYKFVGWMIDGKIVSTDAEYTISLSAEQNKVVNAIYEQCPVYEPKDDGVDSTTLIIGIAAVIIALIAVIYAVIQKKQ